MRLSVCILLCLTLGACTATEHNIQKFNQVFKKNHKAANDALVSFFGPDPVTQMPPPPAVESAYCYKTSADVLCYRQPLPGQESRLVAYQPQPYHVKYGTRYPPKLQKTAHGSTHQAVPVERVSRVELGGNIQEGTVPHLPEDIADTNVASDVDSRAVNNNRSGPTHLMATF